MRVIVVRIGADQTAEGGEWNAPVDADTGEFVYSPIVESSTELQPSLIRRFDELVPKLEQFHAKRGGRDRSLSARLEWMKSRPMHLDPDFEHLTYGDNADRRGAALLTLAPGDAIVFYSGLRPVRPLGHLIYAMTGLYVVDAVVRAIDVPPVRHGENAHTRKSAIWPGDVVVRAKPEVSGRCERCVPIGELRGSNYYLRPELEARWGGFKKADGSFWKSPNLNRSGTPPILGDPESFWTWWRETSVSLVRSNFP